MFKRLREFRRTLRERRDYECLVSKLERINADEAREMDRSVAQGCDRQVVGAGRR